MEAKMKIDFGPSFDWFDVLEKLNNGAEISTQDFWRLAARAGKWPNCACGQLCALLPKRENNESPRDHKLEKLGIEFSGWVNARHWHVAIECMNQIEIRSTELLQEMGINVKLVEHPRHFEKTEKPTIRKSYAAQLAEPGSGHNQRVAQ